MVLHKSGPPASMGQSFLQTGHAVTKWPVNTKAGQSAHRLANQHMGWPNSPSTLEIIKKNPTLHSHTEQDTPMLHNFTPQNKS